MELVPNFAPKRLTRKHLSLGNLVRRAQLRLAPPPTKNLVGGGSSVSSYVYHLISTVVGQLGPVLSQVPALKSQLNPCVCHVFLDFSWLVHLRRVLLQPKYPYKTQNQYDRNTPNTLASFPPRFALTDANRITPRS